MGTETASSCEKRAKRKILKIVSLEDSLPARSTRKKKIVEEGDSLYARFARGKIFSLVWAGAEVWRVWAQCPDSHVLGPRVGPNAQTHIRSQSRA